MKSDYHARREARIERLHARAKRKGRESSQACQTALDVTAMIPPGQPILVGHHSEKRHRRALARSDSYMDKSVTLQKEAEKAREQAIAAENNTAISSDNPDALQLLKEKLASLEAEQKRMKDTNKAFKKGPEALKAMGYSDQAIALINKTVEEAYSWDKKPYAGYQLQNNNQRIKATRDRITALERAENDVTQTFDFEGGKIIDNVEDNRVQIFFDERPSGEMCSRLDKNGFNWAKSVGAWQRFRSNGRGLASARRVLNL